MDYVIAIMVVLAVLYISMVFGIFIKLNQYHILTDNISAAFLLPIGHFILAPVYILFIKKDEDHKINITKRIRCLYIITLMFPCTVMRIIDIIKKKNSMREKSSINIIEILLYDQSLETGTFTC